MDQTLSFGYWVRRRRKALDLTQEQLARLVPCALATIKKIELDERRPSSQMARRLADCLHVSPVERQVFLQTARAERSADRLALDAEPLLAEEQTAAFSGQRTNLRLPAGRLIGRAGEIELVSGLIRSPSQRLVTLTGPAGVGKTRLALQVAADLAPHFPDGDWLADFAPLSDPSLVAQEVASILGVMQAPGRSLIETLVYTLGNRRVLLLLDNCEHLIQACAELAHTLLTSNKGLIILAASREPLNIPWEVVWPVHPLQLPDIQRLPPLEELSQIAAVDLFLDRAWHALPTFSLTQQNSSALARICCRLDGMPLAIELAAARVRALSAMQIERMLDDAFRLLDGGYRTALPRQQTLRSAIDWSYTLLSQAERLLLQRLSVFAGGWAFDAAEKVCAGDGQDVPLLNDFLALLTALVDKSMVTAIRQAGQERRYNLLEIIRQYAYEKLLESGEMATVRQEHLLYFMKWVETLSPELHGRNQAAWLERLDLEVDNLRLALAWGLETDPPMALRLATALYRYWRVRNLLVEGMDWLKKLVNLPENSASTLDRARALGVLSSLGAFHAPLPEDWARESLAISQTLGDRPSQAFAYWMLGSIAYLRREDFEQGRAHLSTSLELYRSIGDRWGMAQVTFHLANLSSYQGDALAQRSYLEQSLAYYREVDDIRGIAHALDSLANAIMDIEVDLQVSLHMVEEALAIYRQIKAGASMLNALYVYATILSWKGEFVHARSELEEMLEIERQSGSQSGILLAKTLLAGLDRLAGLEQRAEPVLEECLAEMKATASHLIQRWHFSRLLHEMAYILARRGETIRARSLLQEAWDACEMPEERAQVLLCRGSAALSEQDGEAAIEDYWQSLEICKRGHFKLFAILALEGVAGALSLLSKPRPAAQLLGSVAEFRRRIGAPVSPWDRPAQVRLHEDLKNRLGEAEFEQAWDAGRATSFDRAIEDALSSRSWLVSPVDNGISAQKNNYV